MALAGMLSALREIILEVDQLPQEESERRLFFAARFSRLSPEEVRDLAKIDPERFKVYSSTVLNGESSTLQNHFPISFALLELASQHIKGASFDSFELAKLLQRSHPWKSISSDYLAASFVEFVPKQYEALIKVQPIILDTLRLELATLRAKRALQQAPRELCSPQAKIGTLELASLSIGELLACRWQLSPTAAIEAFAHDVITLWYRFHRQGKTLPELDQYAAGDYWGCVYRDPQVSTRWIELPNAIAETLQTFKQGSIEQLALEYISTPEIEPLAEPEQFRGFIDLLNKIIELGALQLNRPNVEVSSREAAPY